MTTNGTAPAPYADARNCAQYHSRNGRLRAESRAYFAAVADGRPEPDDGFLPFWDALTSVASMGGTTAVRKGMTDALTTLRTVVSEHGTVPAPPVTLTLPRNVADLVEALLGNAAEDGDHDDTLLAHFHVTTAAVDDVRATIRTALNRKA